MRRTKLFKRVLAGSLGLLLVIPGAVPAMATEAQQTESVIEAEAASTEVAEEIVETVPEETVEAAETALTEEAEVITEETPTEEAEVVPEETAEEVPAETEEAVEAAPAETTEEIEAVAAPAAETAPEKAQAETRPEKAEAVEAVGVQQPGAVQRLAVKEMDNIGITFTHAPVSGNFNVYYEYSTNKSFDEKKAETETFTNTLYYGNLKVGVTYYVRAYAAEYRNSSVKGAYSNVVQVKAPVAEVTNISTEILDKGVTLTMYADGGVYSGFQIDRKSGKSYKNLKTTASSRFKDTGLKKNTKYTYRVRAYAYNPDNGKTVYGNYSYKTIETGTAAMDLKAQVAGKSSVKLTWKKVSSAAGYDVYRSVGSSSSTTVKSGTDYSFNKYELVKSLSKKKASYTDKNLLTGEYSYRVRAYKLVNGNKIYFTEDTAEVKISAKFSMNSSVSIYKKAQNPKNGKVTIAWYPVSQAKGYLVEKYDSTKSEWVTQKKITKATTRSYVLPASPLGTTIQYRVRAYNGNKYSASSNTVSVKGHIAAVTGVKAKATANGIKISWNKVSGASYYRVYRTVDPVATYNADTKTYGYRGYNSSVQIQVFKNADTSDNYYYTLGTGKTKMELDYDAANKQAYHSPSGGVSRYQIPGTSVTDYAYDYHQPVYDDKDVVTGEKVESRGIQSDVSYHYYVIAYKDVKDSKTSAYHTADSYGYSKSASAKIVSKERKAAPTIKKVTAGKKRATVSINKVAGAKKYLIYRSTSKTKGYKLVATTTKTTYTDKKLASKKTYYYKVKAVSKNGVGEDVNSSLSKAKSVRTK